MNRLPCPSIGAGPPLILLLFTPDAANPTGLARRYLMRTVRPFTENFTVHVLNQPPGLPPTTTMAELAACYAHAIKATFTGPVDVLGLSTGGSVALQLAADRPELVARLALGGTACTLGPIGRRAQAAMSKASRGGGASSNHSSLPLIPKSSSARA
jgi:pimeloyl-ACP methyl ester carboxylesterase